MKALLVAMSGGNGIDWKKITILDDRIHSEGIALSSAVDLDPVATGEIACDLKHLLAARALFLSQKDFQCGGRPDSCLWICHILS